MTESTDSRPTFLLVGTGHWGNPGKDYKSVEFDDMLARGRQAQISECLDRLLDFAPTKVAVEIMAVHADETNENYRQYRAGKFALTANERHQLGFRLAAQAGHESVHCVDWHDLEREIGWDRAIEFAQKRNQRGLISFFSDVAHETELDRQREREQITHVSVRDQLVRTNMPEAVARSHWVYMDLAQIGEGDNYIGADVVLRWYERNLKIFINLSRLANDPDDRIVVVIGGGHLPLLSHFIETSGRFRREHTARFLP